MNLKTPLSFYQLDLIVWARNKMSLTLPTQPDPAVLIPKKRSRAS